MSGRFGTHKRCQQHQLEEAPARHFAVDGGMATRSTTDSYVDLIDMCTTLRRIGRGKVVSRFATNLEAEQPRHHGRPTPLRTENPDRV
jgi:hypothetical protein